MICELMAIPDLSRLGSIVTMLIFISFLVIAHEMGHFWVARRCGIKVERFGFGLPFGPTLWSRKINGVEYCIHACLFGGYVSFPDDDPNNPLPADSPERFENNPLLARLAVMLAGVTVNAVLGWLILFFVLMHWGYPTGEGQKKVLIGSILSSSAPAAIAGLHRADEIKSVAGVTIQGADYMAMMKEVKSLLEKNQNHTVPMSIVRKGHWVNVQVTPNAEGHIGVQLGAVQAYKILHDPIEGAAKTTHFLGTVIEKQFEAFGKLFTGKMPLNELAGPIRLVNEGANMINQNGIQTGLMLTAIISTILAVMNLLPIPALDGGHVFFLLIEAIKGSPLKQEVREKFTQFGFVGLLTLIGFILLNDINNTFIHPIH